MTRNAYAWELRKLAAQRRTFLGLGAAVIAPIVLVVAIQVRPPHPTDPGSPFFLRFAVESGLAVPLLMLLFASVWLFPLVAALVAGDIVAAEDGNRTLKTILTRSAGRNAIFAATGIRLRSLPMAPQGVKSQEHAGQPSVSSIK